MPKLSICIYPGCSKAVEGKYCINHNKNHSHDNIMVRNRQAKRKRNTGSTVWQRMRKLQLIKEPYCRICKAIGVLSVSTVVDHIDGDTFNESQSNFQSLCKECHDRKTMRENR